MDGELFELKIGVGHFTKVRSWGFEEELLS